MISVLIRTHDDERDLPGCLESVAWCDDVHVAEAGSATASIAFRHPWVLVLDADERSSSASSTEMQAAVAAAMPTTAGFRVPRHDRLWGSRLQLTALTTYPVRLLRVESLASGVSEEPLSVAGLLNVAEKMRDLHSPLIHLALTKGIGEWVAERNQLSSTEAEQAAGKALVTPLRPFLHWFSAMFVQGAVLDGRAGFLDATAQSFYEFVVLIKIREIKRHREGLPV